jgi:GntR family transcriptional regulator
VIGKPREPREPVPKSRQLAAELREQIRSGKLAPGTQLPSILELAEQHQMAPVTVRKALGHLRDEGLIVSVPGWGTFVRDPEVEPE